MWGTKTIFYKKKLNLMCVRGRIGGARCGVGTKTNFKKPQTLCVFVAGFVGGRVGVLAQELHCKKKPEPSVCSWQDW